MDEYHSCVRYMFLFFFFLCVCVCVSLVCSQPYEVSSTSKGSSFFLQSAGMKRYFKKCFGRTARARGGEGFLCLSLLSAAYPQDLLHSDKRILLKGIKEDEAETFQNMLEQYLTVSDKFLFLLCVNV